MNKSISRRDMLRTATLAGAGLWIGSRPGLAADSKSPNERMDIAVIGVGGRGRANLGGVSKQNIVALCDVDDKKAGDAYKRFPKAEKFYDYRRMLDKMSKSLDAVVVSTPDHSHFHPCYAALQSGLHLYCEKPMAHNLWEVRTLTKLARKNKLATQLGVQRHTIPNVHRVVELIQSGAIGDVKECHAWVDGRRGMPNVPTEFPPAPDTIKWDLWRGPTTQDRKFHEIWGPYNWRFWWDYGTGETGNWGCHILDIPFWALDLKYPTHVQGSGPEVDAERTPRQMATRLDFPTRGKLPEVKLHWYHSSKTPDAVSKLGIKHKGSGVLFVGSKGQLQCSFQNHKLYPEEKFVDFERPAATIPNSPGFYNEWFTACRGGEAATCNFDYSGPLTETVLLGNVAYRASEAFEWDAENLIARGSEKAQALVREAYRKGWEISGA